MNAVAISAAAFSPSAVTPPHGRHGPASVEESIASSVGARAPRELSEQEQRAFLQQLADVAHTARHNGRFGAALALLLALCEGRAA